ncbi:MAG: CBS domain-containing protein [Candidatus Rokubacteria bacterium]|nr:CBS domain-containing protein [Candidatus Rokubacteria bacterium]
MMMARDLMTPSPATVMPGTSLGEAWDLMRELDVRHLPVVERGALVGMLSDRDLAYLDLGRTLAAEGADAVRRALARPVVEVMSSDVVGIDVDAELGDVIDLLLEYRIGAIPVTRSDTRELVGIISYIDVLRVLRDVVEER